MRSTSLLHGNDCSAVRRKLCECKDLSPLSLRRATSAPTPPLAELTADDLFSTSTITLGNDALLFTGLTLTFLKQFGVGLWLTLPLLSSLALGIILLGLAVGKKEGWPRFDSLYWSFITATTVGYGDIRPTKRGSRIIAILIAFLGLLLSGIIIAVAVQAATVALQTSGARP